jgi:lactoylglutathione lyase
LLVLSIVNNCIAMKKLFFIIAVALTTFSGTAQQSTRIKPVLNHIAFYVKNLQTSTYFYQQIIGLDTMPEPFHDGRHTWFRLGPTAHLHLIAGKQQPIIPEKNTHLCFSVASVTDVMKKLTNAGIAFESWAGEQNKFTTRVDGVKQIYFKDPDGYWIEMNDAPE